MHARAGKTIVDLIFTRYKLIHRQDLIFSRYKFIHLQVERSLFGDGPLSSENMATLFLLCGIQFSSSENMGTFFFIRCNLVFFDENIVQPYVYDVGYDFLRVKTPGNGLLSTWKTDFFDQTVMYMMT